MYKIKCSEMTPATCDFTVEAETKEEAKNKFYAHGAESDIHKEKYENASEEEKAEFGKKLDEYLSAQDQNN